jgi:FKBP-type peptidyl-prolyl cis-trans isomerase 2
MKKRNMTLFAVLLGFITVLLFFVVSSEGAEKEKKGGTLVVSEGKSVKVHYTLTVDGKVVDSSNGREPLQFKAGSHEMIPGFEKGVMGMKVGEKKSFKVSPEEGYGPENPKAIQNIPKNQLPPDITPKAGMTLYAQGKNGQRVPVRVIEVKEDVVVMNFNHPLAGKTLNFDVEVVEIQ